jgi:hypothetical protein
MPVTASWSFSQGGTQKSTSKTLSPSDEGVVSINDVAVSNGSTDKVLALGGIDVSQAVAVYMHSTAALTIETNHTAATGGNTITLAANVPLVWCTGAPFSNPLTNDVTVAYATNSSGSAAVLNIVVVQDSTP